jgi:hypothetical protein
MFNHETKQSPDNAYYDMITTRSLYHVGDEFSCNGRSALILLVLSRVGEKWYHGSDSFGACDFAGVDHDAQLHEGCIYRSAPSSDDIDIVLPYRLCDTYAGLANTTASYFCFRKG